MLNTDQRISKPSIPQKYRLIPKGAFFKSGEAQKKQLKSLNLSNDAHNHACLNVIYKTIPINDLKAIPINPVRIIVIPKPFNPFGTLLYFNFSLIAASAIIAKNHPKPDPDP